MTITDAAVLKFKGHRCGDELPALSIGCRPTGGRGLTGSSRVISLPLQPQISTSSGFGDEISHSTRCRRMRSWDITGYLPLSTEFYLCNGIAKFTDRLG